jgi:hypothetical protein
MPKTGLRLRFLAKRHYLADFASPKKAAQSQCDKRYKA